MAEFSELVRIKKRICAKYKKGECVCCPISGVYCGIISISNYADFEFKGLEDALTAWAAEHPVVYPTVYEWLVSIGLLGNDMWSMSDMHKPIPADIAQKLGIEPKEGT